jgi:hypothetical protein
MSFSYWWGRCRGHAPHRADIAVGEKYVVAVHRATGQHNGKTLDSTSCEVVLVVRGRVQEVWATHANQAEADAFWA